MLALPKCLLIEYLRAGDCQLMVAYYVKTNDEPGLEVELLGSGLTESEYLAVGFSADRLMNDDFVFACTEDQVAAMYNGKDHKNYFDSTLAGEIET